MAVLQTCMAESNAAHDQILMHAFVQVPIRQVPLNAPGTAHIGLKTFCRRASKKWSFSVALSESMQGTKARHIFLCQVYLQMSLSG